MPLWTFYKTFLTVGIKNTEKIIGRKAGQDHFNAKDSGSKGQHKKRTLSVYFSNKAKARFLPGRFK